MIYSSVSSKTVLMINKRKTSILGYTAGFSTVQYPGFYMIGTLVLHGTIN